MPLQNVYYGAIAKIKHILVIIPCTCMCVCVISPVLRKSPSSGIPSSFKLVVRSKRNLSPRLTGYSWVLTSRTRSILKLSLSQNKRDTINIKPSLLWLHYNLFITRTSFKFLSIRINILHIENIFKQNTSHA